MTDVDVAIAGGGVAGSSLAIFLGRAGLSVSLFEQHRFPREKACAEGLMPAGVGVLARLGLVEAVGGARFCGTTYRGFGTEVSAQFPDTPAFGLGQRRLRLDTALFEEAARTPGVTARQEARVHGPLVEGNGVTGLLIDGQPVRARLVVAADGPRSPLRRKLGLDGKPRGRRRLGVRAHFRLPPGASVPTQVEVFVGAGHELYLTPLPDGEVSLAALTDAANGQPHELFRRWIAEHPRLSDRLADAEQVSELAGQLPLESRARRGIAPGLVLLGDAAGFLDPITGGGMAQALLSAELLAATVATDLGWDRLRLFDRRRRALVRDLGRLTRLLLLLSHRPAIARGTLRAMARLPRLYRHMVGVAAGTRPLL